MEISKTYQPNETERKWYQHWLDKGYFNSKPDHRPPFSIVIPPPNVTGVLHMGHMLNNTIQDVLIRKARLQGYNACWVPGTDHASIATEAKVVQMLRKEGIKKSDLSREKFLEHAWEWKEKYGGIILEQLKKLGASVDWNRVHFTMDDTYYKAVIRVFVDLHNKGYIYRGKRMINWDVEAKTALSNEEVIYNEEGDKSFLYHVKYFVKDSDEYITIATQRPETIMGDVAVAVNPDDERYKHLLGKKVLVPMIHREIPVIADSYVEKEFGTGCLKVTPAHDQNDNEIGVRHNLEVIDTLNEDGTLNELCEIPEYVGKDRFEVKQLVIERLKAEGLLIEEEEFITRIGRSERTNTVIEPRLSEQWFISMKEISKRALEAVENDEIQLHPAKFKNTYRHWMENVRDWCISRQLWWGHRIPAWYDEAGNVYVAETEAEAYEKYHEKQGTRDKEEQKINDSSNQKSEIRNPKLKQDEDVLDTWASSWLWPMAVFDGFNDNCFDKQTGKINKAANAELNYYYPTQILVTAPEILFFWVARMIIAGYKYLDEKPFTDVYLHGIVRDKQRRKMSKSLGNSPDPLDLIKQYGADGVRVGMLLSSPAGNDLLFDEKLCEQGRNFCNKIWNALRLIKGWEEDIEMKEENIPAIHWFEQRLNESIVELEKQFKEYRLSDALMTLYKLVWDDFCSWYLEMIKPEYQKPIDKYTLSRTIGFFEKLMQLLHPFMPFITEEVWAQLAKRHANESIMLSEYPQASAPNTLIVEQGAAVIEAITRIREIRSQNNLKPRDPMQLFIESRQPEKFTTFQPVLQRLAVLASIEFVNAEVPNTKTFIIKGDRFYVETGQTVDAAVEKEKLLKELEYTKGFIASVQKKLSNERFVQNAKTDILEKERQKLADGEAKVKLLEESIAGLN